MLGTYYLGQAYAKLNSTCLHSASTGISGLCHYVHSSPFFSQLP